jgi:FdhD protein
MAPPVVRVQRVEWRAGSETQGTRAIPEETAVAFTYNGSTYAVMMASPQNLDDFALGFSLTEGTVKRASDIEQLELVESEFGIELRMWLGEAEASTLAARRRQHAGPTGCGLCGIESLAEAMRPSLPVSAGVVFTPDEIMTAMGSLVPAQVLNQETRAVHAAAFWQRSRGLVALREDVGRHNALDKLGGALARSGEAADQGLIVLTSRVSVEMVQKASAIGSPMIVAVSAPTALAVRMADAAGITLAAIARSDSFEVFTHKNRVQGARLTHVA